MAVAVAEGVGGCCCPGGAAAGGGGTRGVSSAAAAATAPTRLGGRPSWKPVAKQETTSDSSYERQVKSSSVAEEGIRSESL